VIANVASVRSSFEPRRFPLRCTPSDARIDWRSREGCRGGSTMPTLRGSLLSFAAGLAALAMTVPADGQTRTLKMQSTWPASLTLPDNFRMFAERVDKLTSGTVKI